MKLKSVSMIEDRTGRRYAYPAVVAEIPRFSTLDDAIRALRADDIGQLFPDTDPAYKGADSLKLLSHVAELARSEGYVIQDVDCTVAAQAPKLAPHRSAMRANLAAAMGVDVSQVGVKATTTEHLGFVGRKEGIAAWAVALLEDGRC